MYLKFNQLVVDQRPIKKLNPKNNLFHNKKKLSKNIKIKPANEMETFLYKFKLKNNKKSY